LKEQAWWNRLVFDVVKRVNERDTQTFATAWLPLAPANWLCEWRGEGSRSAWSTGVEVCAAIEADEADDADGTAAIGAAQ
jgi:hypothetical protein